MTMNCVIQKALNEIIEKEQFCLYDSWCQENTVGFVENLM